MIIFDQKHFIAQTVFCYIAVNYVQELINQELQ